MVLYLTDDLDPVLDLNTTIENPQMTHFWRVSALPDGGAFVHKRIWSNRTLTDQVWRVNVTGQVIQHVYQCVKCNVQGLLVLNDNVYVIYSNGTLIEISINNINTVQVYQVPNVDWIMHSGSLSYHPSVIIHPDVLLLADYHKSEIFSYNVTSKSKKVLLTGVRGPSSVSFITYNHHIYYVVNDRLHDRVYVYNSTWSLYKTIDGRRFDAVSEITSDWGTADIIGSLYWPQSAIGLPDGSVIIIDWNDRVTLFTIHGKFVRHVTQFSGLFRPLAMSLSLPYLWLIDRNLYRYTLY